MSNVVSELVTAAELSCDVMAQAAMSVNELLFS
jgi:hypothetical protein